MTEGLLATQAELVGHIGLDLAWLEQHLPDHALAVASVDALMH